MSGKGWNVVPRLRGPSGLEALRDIAAPLLAPGSCNMGHEAWGQGARGHEARGYEAWGHKGWVT